MADEHNDHEQNEEQNESQDSENNASQEETTEPAHTEHGDHEEHHGPDFKMYMIVFGVLSVCTLASFGTYRLQQEQFFSAMVSLFIIMVISIVKATLVAMIFMHLKWDWIKIYIILVPIVILTFMMMVVLLPDTVQSDLDEIGPPSLQYSGHVPEKK